MDLHVLGYLSAELGKAKVDGIKKIKKKKSGLRTELFPERHKRALRVRTRAGSGVIETPIGDQGWPPPARAPLRGGVTLLPAGTAQDCFRRGRGC